MSNWDKTSATKAMDHMNDDHRDANVLYVKAWGGLLDAQEVQDAYIQDIEPTHMSIKAIKSDQSHELVKVAFDPVLQEASELHQRLIAMVKSARGQLQG